MLSEQILNMMAEKAAQTMLMEGSVKGLDRTALKEVLLRAFTKEVHAGEELAREAEKLLAAHAGAMKGQMLDLGELRRKILQKLAQERGVVLK